MMNDEKQFRDRLALGDNRGEKGAPLTHQRGRSMEPIMSRWDLKNRSASRTIARTIKHSPRLLSRLVGRALGMSGSSPRLRSFRGMESLEQRQMLEGSFGTPTVVALTNGAGTSAGAITVSNAVTDNDYYVFTMPGAANTTNFVSLIADTKNETPTVSSLDTRVTVFAETDLVNPIVSGIVNANGNVVTGVNNGTLTTGLARDGWAGFVGTAGVRYFVIVSSDSSVGAPVSGTYTLRVNAGSTEFDMDEDTGIAQDFVPQPPPFPEPIPAILNSITLYQQDVVYKYVAPADAAFNSLVTVNAQVTVSNRLNTRLDIYKQSEATGKITRIAFDSDAGRLNDAFATFLAAAGETYWIRLRSDISQESQETPLRGEGVGQSFLVLDARADEFPQAMNPVTRRASDPGNAFFGFDDPNVAPNPALPNPTFQTASYRFVAQGTGLAIITGVGVGLAPVGNSALRVFDDTGALVAFNDNFAGTDSQVKVQIIGGREYFVVIDGFEVSNAVQYAVFVESNHTFNTSADTLQDDHQNMVANPAATDPVIREQNRRLVEGATPLLWSDPFLTFDDDGNIVRDRSLRVEAFGTGRLEAPGDNDVFQFVPPVDMIGRTDGDNDDAGVSLFTGGRFELADPNVVYPTLSRGLTSYDGGDWWYTGDQRTDANGVTFGFTANGAASGRPEIYTTLDWDANPAQDPADGTTDHFLIVGGDFTLTIPGAFGPVVMTNIAAWGWSAQAGKFLWVDVSGGTGGADGAVRALTTFDPVAFDPDGNKPLTELDDPGDNFIVAGGDFLNIGGVAANRIAFFGNGGWNAIGTGITGGANPSVRSLAVYDPDDAGDERAASAGPPALTRVPDSPNHPRMLFVGGQFTTAGGIASANLAMWSGQTAGASSATSVVIGPWNTPNIGSSTAGTKPAWAINGAVNAMIVMDIPDVDGGGDFEGGQRLIVAGEFTSIGGGATSTLLPGAYNRIAMFGRKAAVSEPNMDPAVNNYNPRLVWDRMDGGVGTGAAGTEPIRALTVWDPVDTDFGEIAPVLAVGGEFLTAGGAAAPSLALWQPVDGASLGWGGLGLTPVLADGSTGVVNALAAFADPQEPQIPITADVGGSDPQQVLYIGGSFIGWADALGNVTPTNNVSAFAFDQNIPGFTMFSLGQGQGGGVDNLDPDETTDAEVFTLGTFAEKNPLRWDHHDRPADRLTIVVQPNFGGFENTEILLYDSNLNLLYQNNTIDPLAQDPSGSIDPSLTAGEIPPAQFTANIDVWGGEVYYLVVRDLGGGGGTGRYNVFIQADTVPPPDDTIGLPQDMGGFYAVETREGDFPNATNLPTALGTGDTNLTTNAATNPPLSFRSARAQIVEPSTNNQIIFVSDLGNITSIDDTDLWNFRAEFTGTVEIRIGTRDIDDQYGELHTDIFTGEEEFEGVTKKLSSPLDSALRIFDNDFNQIGYNNDNFAVKGELTTDSVVGIGTGEINADGDPTDLADFYRRDARIVFNVVAGNFYYVQVESGQRWVDGRPEDVADRTENLEKEIDWRRTQGGYQMYINQMPNLATDIENGQTVRDDHAPNPVDFFDEAFATPIEIGDGLSSLANGTGSITGVINNTPNNPNDADDFNFFAVGSGQSRIVVTPTGAGNGLTPTLFFFDVESNQPAVTGTPGPNGTVSVLADLIVGRRYGIRVVSTSGGSNEGAYRIDVTPVVGSAGSQFRDDFADRTGFWNATDIPLLDFQGSGSITGKIEVAGDTDVFRFSVVDFAEFTVTVTPNDITFNPTVEVYEISEDPVTRPVALRIANNDNLGAGQTAARVVFPVTPNRIIDVPDPGEDRVYPYYYIVVKGADVQSDSGTYTVTINFPATDDHPDATLNNDGITRDTSQYALATTIAIDNLTGLGSSAGEIELLGDTDLLSFNSPASGSATVTITRPVESTIRTRVVILASGLPGSASVTLASAVAPDSDSNGTATITFNVSRGVRYMILVEGFGPPNANTTLTGAYNVAVTAPPIDDFPNATEWGIASAIAINNITGIGQVGGDAFGDISNANISPNNDTDLFKFTAVANGTYNITINSFASSGNGFAPRLRIYDASQNLVDTITATTAGQQITGTIAGVTAGTTYFILIDAVGSLTPTTGEYRVIVAGPAGTGGGGGPDPSIVDFNNPVVINLDEVTGKGTKNDLIDVANDRDLFTFTTFNFSGPGFAFVQVVTPQGTLLDATVRILRNPNELASSEVIFDADGLPGATANAAFLALPNTQYWIVVDGVGTTTGSYTIRVSTRPGDNFLYFPEGYANDAVNSRVAITNPNNVQATFSIIARYETGSFETVLATGTIEPNSSIRQVISGAASIRPAGLRTDAPFALVIVSNVALGATFTHTDFGGSLGEAFTDTVAPTWNFARVERNPGGNLDFLLFYNPNGFDAEVTVTAYQTGASPVAVSFKVGGGRRGGLAINDLPTFPRGVFSVVVTSRAADSAFDAQYKGVVASQSHYDLVTNSAFATMGDQGSTAQVVSNFSQGIITNSDITLFNPGTSATTVTLTGNYISPGLPGITRTYDIQPKTQLRLRGTDLGLVTDQHIGLRFRSSSNVSILATQTQRGEADATAASADAGTRFFFGDAFINTFGAGNLYFQTFNVFNPSATAINVNVRLLFADGTTSIITMPNVAGRGYAELRLHERPEIITQRSGDVLFAIDATSTSPFVATLSGYDLSRDSGWTIQGQAFGLTNPISRI